MILTEAEAKSIWCPFVRVAFLGATVANRGSSSMLAYAEKEAARSGDARDLKYYQEQAADCNCIASRCMAWRWSDPARDGGWSPGDQDKGYCGLAGQP